MLKNHVFSIKNAPFQVFQKLLKYEKILNISIILLFYKNYFSWVLN